VAGRTKTRLCPQLSPHEAAAFNTAVIQDPVGNILAAGALARVTPYVAYGPSGAGHFFGALLRPDVGRVEAALPGFGAWTKRRPPARGSTWSGSWTAS